MPDLSNLPYEQAIFYLVSALAVGCALAMILSKNAVHAALFMVANFGLVAVLYLLLRASFIATIQVIVYAGAIMVLFLFVIMMLNVQEADPRSSRGPQDRLFTLGSLAPLLGLGLLGALAYVALGVKQPAATSGGLVFANIQDVGALLFTRYLYPFEITSLLLLVAMIGAVVLAKRR
ncbi:MAG: NADH-quinone oxidoreductase subunit J [Chloroflexi bacterium]|nr:NADH-quinone oxidoreductase subunit J [Chloroflexota bacterium]MBI3734343.1 NADH-quinone oxidoreductase subunit J [Chloroflexota bacterium]